MFLVLLETSGNQGYIFSTNKLRENVGASELTFRAGTKWVLDAVAQNGGHPRLGIWKNSQGTEEVREDKIRKKLMDSALNPPLESTPGINTEIILATSGKALILTRDEEKARKIIQAVTLKALEEAPGLDIFGVFEEFNWEREDLSDVNERVHRKFAEARSHNATHHLRFLRLPVVDQCATSGLPANEVDPKAAGGKPVLRSHVSLAKRKNYDSNIERIEELLKRNQIPQSFAKSIKALDDEDEQQSKQGSWRAVIHADGNGLGEIFLKFGTHLTKLGKMTGDISQNNRTYVGALRRFSLALDVCTERAFITALQSFGTGIEKLPIVPLVLGGDDLTVVCDGKAALRFTQQFLLAFDAETKETDNAHYDGILPEIAKAALGVNRLSSCAGVAIIKPHFPFSVAYELSESLMQSAKAVKQKLTHVLPNETKAVPYPCSALDFHVLYDTSGVNLGQIRDRLQPTSDTQLYIAPYIVTPTDDLPVENQMTQWAKPHQWEHLERRIDALNAKDEDGRRKLPNSQMHNLRNALSQGADLADAQYRLIRDRYVDLIDSSENSRADSPDQDATENGDRSTIDIRALEGDPRSLFTKVTDPATGKSLKITGLLDALDAADFLPADLSADPTFQRAADQEDG
ncbi:hypothetical protein [Thermoleptolyngbya sp. M55_K2018_002]|uniref:hypothetical protein n=1 Tax=Thermoleptolyngbya sp. M55_K2018_002 TaxID=2747808 RepID=UPI001A0E610E|nr:hypothetical protein [Thermoleptolyngbya sp. M55_K2018_002]HIK42616.1 hypothetical protein [Thermoleptolyngbya sp. M55_K2018_002]